MLAAATLSQDPALTARTFSQNPTLTAALTRIRAQHTPIPYSRICAVCAHPIFSADTTATEQGGEWTHAGCEPVISGAETNGDDSHDPTVDTPPTDAELNELYLWASGWNCESPRGSQDTVWKDPRSGDVVFFNQALDMQSERDEKFGWSFTE